MGQLVAADEVLEDFLDVGVSDCRGLEVLAAQLISDATALKVVNPLIRPAVVLIADETEDWRRHVAPGHDAIAEALPKLPNPPEMLFFCIRMATARAGLPERAFSAI